MVGHPRCVFINYIWLSCARQLIKPNIVANKVWKHEIMDGQKKGGMGGAVKGRNERRKDDRTEEIEWKNKEWNNREWKEGETQSRRTRKGLNEWKQVRSERVHRRNVERKAEMRGCRRTRNAFGTFRLALSFQNIQVLPSQNV